MNTRTRIWLTAGFTAIYLTGILYHLAVTW